MPIPIFLEQYNIEELGFIQHKNYRVYSFMQEEESDAILDNSKNIEHLIVSAHTIQFNKTYQMHDVFINTSQSIKLDELGFDWEIQKAESTIDYRYGISMTIDDSPVTHRNQQCSSISNYSQEWMHPWDDQLNILLPTVSVQIKNKRAILLGPANIGIQFFTYYENGQKYIRVSSCSDDTNHFRIILKFVENTDIYNYYAEYFPEYKWKIEEWRNSLKKIEDQFAVQISWHQEIHSNNCIGTSCKQEEISEYAKLLYEELKIYPFDILKKLSIKNITICGRLIHSTSEILGIHLKSNLIFNASSDLSTIDKQKTIHHELFHAIESLLTSSCFSAWDNNQDSFSDKQDKEYRSDLFSCMILDPTYINKLAESDVRLKLKIEKLYSVFNNLGENYNLVWHRVNQRQQYLGSTQLRWRESTIEYYNQQKDRNYLLKKHRENGNLANMLKPQPDKMIIVGIDSRFIEIFRIATGVPVKICNTDDDAIQTNEFPVIICCNPIMYCAEKYIHNKENPELSMERWSKIYSTLLKKSPIFLLQEDILTHNLTKINSFLRLVNTKIEEKQLDILDNMNKSDYDIERIPFIRNVFAKQKKLPVFEILRYNFISCTN